MLIATTNAIFTENIRKKYTLKIHKILSPNSETGIQPISYILVGNLFKLKMRERTKKSAPIL